jgi:hypothetical protein
MAFGDEAVRQLTVLEWYKCFKCGEGMWEGDCHSGHLLLMKRCSGAIKMDY